MREKQTIITIHWTPGLKPYPYFMGDFPDFIVMEAINQSWQKEALKRVTAVDKSELQETPEVLGLDQEEDVKL